jgi:metal-responsive CopG/Arc/MetJ family transcriptional regulator
MQEAKANPRKKMKWKACNVRLHDPLYEQVEKASLKRQMTRSAFIRMAVKYFLLEDGGVH